MVIFGQFQDLFMKVMRGEHSSTAQVPGCSWAVPHASLGVLCPEILYLFIWNFLKLQWEAGLPLSTVGLLTCRAVLELQGRPSPADGRFYPEAASSPLQSTSPLHPG